MAQYLATDETREQLIDALASLSLPDRGRLETLICLLSTATQDAVLEAESRIWRLANSHAPEPGQCRDDLDGIIEHLRHRL